MIYWRLIFGQRLTVNGQPLFHSQLTTDNWPFYSVRKLFTGFASAALIDWKLIVIKAVNMANMHANKNIHQLISILYS